MKASHANGLPRKPQNPTHAAASWRERYRRSARPAEADSGWNPNAVSPSGAQGLTQFMPGTWIGEGVDGDGDGVRDPFDPADAIASQASFMRKLLAAVVHWHGCAMTEPPEAEAIHRAITVHRFRLRSSLQQRQLTR